MAPPRKTAHQCEHITRTGEQCNRGATIRVPQLDMWLCAQHKKHKKLPGREPMSEGVRAYRAQKRKRNLRRSLLKCCFVSKDGSLCNGVVSKRFDDGRDCCKYHWDLWETLSPEEREMMESAAVESIIDNRLATKTARFRMNLSRRQVLDLPDIEDQLELLDQEDQKHGHKIKFKEAPINPKSGVKKHGFFGIDVEYYTPEFKVDYVYMLIQSIRRSEAQVNILFQQLQRIEDEEEKLKETVNKGTSIVEGKHISFENKSTRHAIPIELKLKLVESLTKAEAHHAKLLKQMEELPLTCLMVMRKLGVRWDRDASMMVINKIEKENKQILSDFGALDVAPAQPIELKQAMEIIQEDPKMAKNLKKVMQDDDW